MPISTINTNSIADDAVTVPKVTDQVLTHRNLIINGACVIDQRNAGASVTITSAGQYPVDRFRCISDTSAATITAQQSSTAPVGFVNSLLWTASTGSAAASGNDNLIWQKIEGLNISDLGWGTASAQPVTLSFWVRSSLTGTFGVSFRNSGALSYVASYTISAVNTWEKKTVTIAGDTSGTWLTTNGVGINVTWDMGCGASRSTTAGSWQAGSYPGLTGGVKVSETSGATFYITGVQLEVGSVATPFEHRSYGTELALCQRYLYSATNSDTGYIASFWQYDGNSNLNAFLKFPTTMRAEPTLVHNASNSGYFVGYGAGQGLSWTTLTLNSQTLDSAMIFNNQFNAYGSGTAGGLYVGSSAAYLWMDAEI